MAGPGRLVRGVPLDTSFSVFAGVDWAEESHAVCALVDGRRHDRSFANSPDGIQALARWLAELAGERARVAVAIEVPHGPVVEGLLLRGFPVFAINPKQLDRHRDRYSLAGAKDDRRDALVLADSLRIDPKSFRAVCLPPPTIIKLRRATRDRRRLVRIRTSISNRLRSVLNDCAPHYLKLCQAADEPWFWHLLSLLPQPGVSQLSKAKVTAALKRFRITRHSPDDVLACLRMPPLSLAEGTVEACAESIASLLRQLKLFAQEVSLVEARIRTLLAEAAVSPDGGPSDVEIIDSYPGAGVVVVSELLAEAFQPIVERNREALRSQAGCAPVTRRSGKTAFVTRRRAVNPHLRDTAYFLAEAALKKDPWAKSFYARARHRGQDHPRALRGLGDRIIDQLMAMLESRTIYDPGRPRAGMPRPGQLLDQT